MKHISIAAAALILVSASCTKDIREISQDLTPDQNTLMTKLVGGSEGEMIPGTILVKLDSDSISEEMFSELGSVRISPAIPVRPKNMEVAKKYGLHQWYTVSFDKKIVNEDAAEIIARNPSVRSVQYSRYVEPVRAEQAYPFNPVITKTASSDASMPFDDPHVSHQWNLNNDGSISGSAAGADIGVKDAWRLTGGDPSVIVAVFDCAVSHRHEDLADAVWRNEAEINGETDKDDDGNGFIDDKYGFNFVKCYALDSDWVNGSMEGNGQTAVDSQPLNSSSGIGHGTHVAGIIGAVNGNGKGISSIAGGTGNGDGVRLMSCQIFDGSANAADAQSAAAFIYAADNGACIAQCSYGNSSIITEDESYISGSPLETAALLYFLDPANSNHESLEGNIAVFAAGNHGNPYSIYPGALPYVLSVTAFGYDWMPGGYSNYGPGCKISAPGGEWKGVSGENAGMILSTGLSNSVEGGYPGLVTDKGESKNYVYMQGTSMACPHVSGVIALGISYAKKLGKTLTREELTSLLLTSVNDIDQFNKGGTRSFYPPFSSVATEIDMNRYKGQMGTGAVDAWKFLMAIEGTPTLLAEVGKKMSIDISRYCNPLDNYTISVDEATKTALGLSSDPVIRNGRLEIECTKIGSGKITLGGAVGKDAEKEDGIGEMAYSRTLSIASRPFATENGGWL